jgi:hypothetical protein
MFALKRAFASAFGRVQANRMPSRMTVSCVRFASNFTIFDHFHTENFNRTTSIDQIDTEPKVDAAGMEIIQNELVNLALNESEFVGTNIDLKIVGDASLDDIIPLLLINILKRRRKKMNKHKWKKLKRRVRNSTKYNPERRRKMKKEKRKRYLIKNGLLAPDSNFGL